MPMSGGEWQSGPDRIGLEGLLRYGTLGVTGIPAMLSHFWSLLSECALRASRHRLFEPIAATSITQVPLAGRGRSSQRKC